jgi:hypothetical protein
VGIRHGMGGVVGDGEMLRGVTVELGFVVQGRDVLLVDVIVKKSLILRRLGAGKEAAM